MKGKGRKERETMIQKKEESKEKEESKKKEESKEKKGQQEKRLAVYDRNLELEAYRFQGIMQRFPNHFHEFYVIGYIEKGKRHLSCCNREYVVSAGDMVLFNPYENHTCEQINQQPLDYRALNIPVETMQRIAREITGQDGAVVFRENVVVQAPQVEELRYLHQLVLDTKMNCIQNTIGEATEDEAEATKTVANETGECLKNIGAIGRRELEKEELFYFFMENMISIYARPQMEESQNITNPQVSRACSYMEAHYADSLLLADICQAAGLGKYTLLRNFTTQKGVTPYQYLETVRVNHAREALRHGKTPLQAALESGFSDQSHFTHFFKNFIGLTPGQYQSLFR